jgi:hypothetical protein
MASGHCGLLLLLAVPAMALDAVHVSGNPHQAETTTACCPAQVLPAERLLGGAPSLARQPDTFVRVRTRQHLDRQGEVLTFRQPHRLSPRTLPFDLALVDDIDPTGIVEVAAEPEAAADSWFPDYSWSHYVVCTAGEGTALHLGWRFTRKDPAAPGPASFVALIVRADEEEEAAAARVRRRVEAAGGRVSEAEGEGADADAAVSTVSPLQVGVEAPGWITKMVVALTAQRASAAVSVHSRG